MSHSPVRRSSTRLVVSASLAVALLSGCGVQSVLKPGAESAAAIKGKIFGGQQPVKNSLVTVWLAGSTGYGSQATALATTNSLDDGTFSFPANSYTCADPNEPLYITAQGGDPGTGVSNPALALAAGLGPCAGAPNVVVNINEVTTAVTAFALAQFFTPTLGVSSLDSFGGPTGYLSALELSNASTIPTLVNLPMGTVNPNTAEITIEADKIYTIANVLAACVNTDPSSTSTCGKLFTDTTPPLGTVAPSDTLQAAVQMALRPYQNVSLLFKLVTPDAPFMGLTDPPNDWTIGVSYTTTSLSLGINGTSSSGTSSNIDIDASGRVWIPSNGTTNAGVGYFDPASTTFNGPFATGTVTQPQYLAIDQSGYLWLTDLNSGLLEVLDTTNPAAVAGGTPIAGATSTGPIAIDTAGDAYLAYLDAGSAPNVASVDSSSNVSGSIAITAPATGLVVFDNGVNLATSGAGTPCYNEVVRSADQIDSQTAGNCISGMIANAQFSRDGILAATSANELCSAFKSIACFTPVVPLTAPEGIATDGYGNTWVANSGNGSISMLGGINGTYGELGPVSYLHDASNGNTMSTPYGPAIDGSGNVWVANASCVTNSATPCIPSALVLSELIGAAGPTIAPLSSQNNGDLSGTLPGVLLVPAVKAAKRHALPEGFKATGKKMQMPAGGTSTSSGR